MLEGDQMRHEHKSANHLHARGRVNHSLRRQCEDHNSISRDKTSLGLQISLLGRRLVFRRDMIRIVKLYTTLQRASMQKLARMSKPDGSQEVIIQHVLKCNLRSILTPCDV